MVLLSLLWLVSLGVPAGRVEELLDEVSTVLDELSQSEVLLTFDARSDRLGSFLQVGVAAWALAAAHNWRFCTPGAERGRNALYLAHTGWPACGGSPSMRGRGVKRLFSECVRWTDDGVMSLAPGTYRLPDRSGAGGWQAIGRAERAAPGSVWSAARSRDLRAQLIAANQAFAAPRWDASSEARERDDAERVVTVAMHVRRGDVVDNAYWRDRNYYVSDAAFIGVVRALRARYRCGLEVHIFSEDYTSASSRVLFSISAACVLSAPVFFPQPQCSEERESALPPRREKGRAAAAERDEMRVCALCSAATPSYSAFALAVGPRGRSVVPPPAKTPPARALTLFVRPFSPFLAVFPSCPSPVSSLVPLSLSLPRSSVSHRLYTFHRRTGVRGARRVPVAHDRLEWLQRAGVRGAAARWHPNAPPRVPQHRRREPGRER